MRCFTVLYMPYMRSAPKATAIIAMIAPNFSRQSVRTSVHFVPSWLTLAGPRPCEMFASPSFVCFVKLLIRGCCDLRLIAWRSVFGAHRSIMRGFAFGILPGRLDDTAVAALRG